MHKTTRPDRENRLSLLSIRLGTVTLFILLRILHATAVICVQSHRAVSI